MSKFKPFIIAITLIVSIGILFADKLVKPYEFKPGTLIKASEFNANFDTLYEWANGNIGEDNLKSDPKSLGKVSDGWLNLKNGNLGVGTFDPKSRLHIKNGLLLIESTSPQLLMEADNMGVCSLTYDSLATTPFQIIDQKSSTTRLAIQSNGNIGIGTLLPDMKLTVVGGILSQNKDNGLYIGALLNADSEGAYLASTGLGLSTNWKPLYLQAGGATHLTITTSGKVGIGTTQPAYRLDVNGDIRATGSIYYGGSVGANDGVEYIKPDFVFTSSYSALSVAQVKNFISLNGHLPWITPSSSEPKGLINMTRLAFQTLEAVENIQLQVISQQETIDQLRIENQLLKEKNAALEARIQAIEKKLGMM